MQHDIFGGRAFHGSIGTCRNCMLDISIVLLEIPVWMERKLWWIGRSITEFGNGRDSKIRSRPYWYRSGYQNIARSTRLGNRQVKSRFVFYRHDRHGGDGQQSNNQEEYHVQGPIDISEGGQQSKIKDAYHRNDVCISCLRATVSPFFQHAGQPIAPSSPSITSTASGVQLYQCAEQQYQQSHKFITWEF